MPSVRRHGEHEGHELHLQSYVMMVHAVDLTSYYTLLHEDILLETWALGMHVVPLL